jgi:hypothetical protein
VTAADDLDVSGGPSGLCLDENGDLLASAAEIDALAGTIAAGTLSVDSTLVDPPTNMHLQVGSAGIVAGTPVGAPTRDIDEDLRDVMPDIGADER